MAGGALLALAGGSIAWLNAPAWHEGELLPKGRAVLSAVARAVLDGSLPEAALVQAAALEAHLERMGSTLRALPPHTQAEVAGLLLLLAAPPVRLALAGLPPPWETASVADVKTALQSMRESSWLLRRQAYGALRDLTHAAYFSDASAWPLLRYPGPREIA